MVVTFLATVFASLAVHAEVVVPVGVHEAVVAVAERSGTDGLLAGTRGLKDTRASLKGGRAPVVIIRVAAAVAVVVAVTITAFSIDFDASVNLRFLLSENLLNWLFEEVLDADGGGSSYEEDCGKGFHFERTL